jgi:two-component system, chemotaxis family, response regulator PixG
MAIFDGWQGTIKCRYSVDYYLGSSASSTSNLYIITVLLMHSEINPSLLLTQLSSDQTTGCLEVVYRSTTWNIFIRFGQLLSADCSVLSLNQLLQRLRQMGCEEAAQSVTIDIHNNATLSTGLLVNQEISSLVERGLLDQTQLRHLSLELTKESLESLLWLTNGTSTWHPNRLMPATEISNSHNSLKISSLLEYYQQRLTIWQKFNTIIQSPHQRPYLTTENLADNIVPRGTLSPTGLHQISQFMRGVSLRELAMLLKQDELKLVQLLSPYIQHNVILFRKPSVPFDALPNIPKPVLLPTNIPGGITSSNSQNLTKKSKVYQIACIDDSPMILDEIERFLGDSGKYQLTKLDEPVKASAAILRLKPDLILMDITMPNINGYKLCSLFRSSEALADTPIIMVTGNKGLVDQVRAKLVGATDYLTKPFTKEKLLAIVEKYLT